jgi:hypothetical protein
VNYLLVHLYKGLGTWDQDVLDNAGNTASGSSIEQSTCNTGAANQAFWGDWNETVAPG